MSKRNIQPVVHPFILAVHPILYLYSRNMGEVYPVEALVPASIALISAWVLYRGLVLVLRDRLKAGVVVSVTVLMFFLYSPALDYLVRGLTIHGVLVGRHRVFLPLWLLACAVIIRLVTRTRHGFEGTTRCLNVFAFALLAMVAATIGAQTARSLHANRDARSWDDVLGKHLRAERLHPDRREPLRDIYYIVLDEYGRSDVLKHYYNCDNGPFIKHLESKGFRVAEAGRSNYLYTYPGLASPLNMDHIETLAGEMGRTTIDLGDMREMIRNSRACGLLKQAGYKFVFFPTSEQVTSRNPYADCSFSSSRVTLTDFDRVIVLGSILRAFCFDLRAGQSVHANSILFQLEQLKRVPRMKGPTFTFAHILCPHRPFAFDAKGRLPALPAPGDPEPPKLYADQVSYLNQMVRQVVDSILRESEVAPVIIIAGDHGPWIPEPPGGLEDEIVERERSRILSAYYLPDGGDRALYPTITPVNAFRVVFNAYFGAGYKLRPDTTYDIGGPGLSRLSDFTLVNDEVGPERAPSRRAPGRG